MKNIIIFIDSGDTLVDESTEITHDGIVTHAELIPGAKETIKELHGAGHKIVMVADGRRQSFINVHKHQHQLYDYFHGHIYSEDIGVQKPDARMFNGALNVLGLSMKDTHKIVMVGNNLPRDIKGANDMGMISVHIDWSNRYPREPRNVDEKPDYVIKEPRELVDLISKLEREYALK